MKLVLKLLSTPSFKDYRGVLNSFPQLDLKDIVRMYPIEPSSIQSIRAWQGLLKERN